MAKKKASPASAEPASPKRLRRKLEKLEARQASASVKRDRAQARVDALAILADEVRAALAAAEAPTSEPEPAVTPPPPAPRAGDQAGHGAQARDDPDPEDHASDRRPLHASDLHALHIDTTAAPTVERRRRTLRRAVLADLRDDGAEGAPERRPRHPSPDRPEGPPAALGLVLAALQVEPDRFAGRR